MMHPLLFKIGSVPIHSYGVMIALGFLVAVFVGTTLAKKSKLDVERVLDLGFWTFLVGFLGARLYYVLTQFEFFSNHPEAIFRVWEGGLVFYGGPLACLPFCYWYMKKYKMPGWKVADVFIPCLTVAHAFGRLGCLAAGCCYGKPTGTDFGLIFFSDQVEPHLHGIRLHPTQIYESTVLFTLFFGLLWVFKIKKFDGQVALTYFIAYPIIRSVIEIFRGDQVRGFVIENLISWGQFTSGIVFLVASLVLYRRLKAINQAGET
jgi:phosphatidylglycerol:prolipoprotein diacylglycerol transferase